MATLMATMMVNMEAMRLIIEGNESVHRGEYTPYRGRGRGSVGPDSNPSPNPNPNPVGSTAIHMVTVYTLAVHVRHLDRITKLKQPFQT